MEWIRINTNKLKIMLTAEDARHYALRFEKVDYADAITRRAFRSILTDIKKEAGFDATEDRVYIQLYPSREGGCELFITKTGLLPPDENEHIHKTPFGDVGEEPTAVMRRSAAFSFDAIDKMLAVCRRLSARHFAGESESWKDDEGRLWLFLTEEGDPQYLEEDYMFISEYGKIEHADAAALLLSEHGDIICTERAVESLGEL